MRRFQPLLSPEHRAELLAHAGAAAAPVERLTATSPIILDALTAWHEADRYAFERRGYQNLKYDDYEKKHAHDGGKRWLRLDRDTGGVFLVDKLSPSYDVFTIKGYGVPNRRIGTLAQMIASWREQTARNAELATGDHERRTHAAQSAAAMDPTAQIRRDPATQRFDVVDEQNRIIIADETAPVAAAVCEAYNNPNAWEPTEAYEIADAHRNTPPRGPVKGA